MYQLSVPIMNFTVNSSTREEYLRQFKACEVSRVFIVPDTDVENGTVRDFDALAQNLAFFSSHGIEGAIWVGETVGHGGLTHDALKKEVNRFSPLVNFQGEARPGTTCPLNEAFGECLEKMFAQLARAGAKLIRLNASGSLTGNTVALSELPAYSFAAFTVEE